MAKRFTDTEKWKKQFFKQLTPAYKCFWNFITDDCDHSGIWEVEDPQIIALRIGEKVDMNSALQAFNEDEKRVHIFDQGRKWFIIPFVKFQYGTLGEANRLHLAVKNELLKKGLYDLVLGGNEAVTPVKGPLERVKDKEQVKDKVKDKESFGEDGLVLLTPEEHKKLLVKLGERKTAEYVTKLNNYIGSKGTKYKSHYHTILSWSQNDPVKPEKKEKKRDPNCDTCDPNGQLPDGKGKCWCWK